MVAILLRLRSYVYDHVESRAIIARGSTSTYPKVRREFCGVNHAALFFHTEMHSWPGHKTCSSVWYNICMGKPAADLTGTRSGRLVVTGRASNIRNTVMWHCLCDCGNTSIVSGHRIRNCETKSCGCLIRDSNIEKKTKHGYFGSHTYGCWCAMRQRCLNPKNIAFHRYGGAGIRLCDRWLYFENFLADMGEATSPKHSIDRYPDTSGNYEPTNCRWATQKQQCRNRKHNRLIEFQGEILCLADWCDRFSLDYPRTANKITRGTPPSAIFSNPHDWPRLLRVQDTKTSSALR